MYYTSYKEMSERVAFTRYFLSSTSFPFSCRANGNTCLVFVIYVQYCHFNHLFFDNHSFPFGFFSEMEACRIGLLHDGAYPLGDKNCVYQPPPVCECSKNTQVANFSVKSSRIIH